MPIIAYSIVAAQGSGLFDAILVSTDSDEIAAVAQKYGAAFHRRPSSLADDHTGTQAVMRDALLNCGQPAEYACCVYPTAPMMTPQDLKDGWRALTDPDGWYPVYAFAVTPYDFPVQRSLRMDRHGSISAAWPADAEKRSQDLEEHWHDAGQWYWGRADAFVRDVPLYSPASIGVPLPRYRVMDIDTEEDWIQAELMYTAMKGRP